MNIIYGIEPNDMVTIPVEWVNITSGLPSGKSIDARVHSVSGPVTTLETLFGDFVFATVLLRGWLKR